MKGIKTKIKLFLALAALIVVGIYYYVALPGNFRWAEDDASADQGRFSGSEV